MLATSGLARYCRVGLRAYQSCRVARVAVRGSQRFAHSSTIIMASVKLAVLTRLCNGGHSKGPDWFDSRAPCSARATRARNCETRTVDYL